MGLYLHIPFCERRCTFCEYCVVREHSPRAEERYHAGLMRELDLYLELMGRRQRCSPLVGLDIGGGTPSLVAPHRIQQLMERVVAGFRLQQLAGQALVFHRRGPGLREISSTEVRRRAIQLHAAGAGRRRWHRELDRLVHPLVTDSIRELGLYRAWDAK